VQHEIFKQLPREEEKLVMAVTHNVAFYAEGDATICCSFGTHGSDAATGNSFVLASYLYQAPEVIQKMDVQAFPHCIEERARPLPTDAVIDCLVAASGIRGRKTELRPVLAHGKLLMRPDTQIATRPGRAEKHEPGLFVFWEIRIRAALVDRPGQKTACAGQASALMADGR
jgi:hypothetical protein